MPTVEYALVDWANETEKKCYRALAELDIEFIPQYAIDRYRADAYLPKYKVVLEFDDPGHNYGERKAHDEARDAYMAVLGMYTLRIPYKALKRSPLRAIRQALYDIGIPSRLRFGQCSHSISEIAEIETRQHMYLAGYAEACGMLFPIFRRREF